jgi:hypothetical protein
MLCSMRAYDYLDQNHRGRVQPECTVTAICCIDQPIKSACIIKSV